MIRTVLTCVVSLLLAGVGALDAAGATDRQPPSKLWSEFPLAPTTTSAAPSTPTVARARQISSPAATAAPDPDGEQSADDTSLALVAGLAFGFAAAGTAFAVAVITGIQAFRRRRWLEHTGGDDERAERPDAQPPRQADPPQTPSRPPVTPTLVDVTQPVARPAVPRPAPLPTSTEDEIVVALWRGYVKSRFYATAARPDGTETTLAASPYFRLARKRPIAESKSARNAYDALRRDLAELGWRPVETGEVFASRFRR